ncbi:MAG: DUF4419 domain-containing protein [Planctomycetaceae bacterium]
MLSTFTPPSVVLPLSDVEIAQQAAGETGYRDALLARIRFLERTRKDDPPATIEACSSFAGQLLNGVENHPVATALHRAYAEHRPVRFAPDTLWLLVCQGVAQHVHLYAEELRPHFVSHSGRMELKITVDADQFHAGSPENPWPVAIEMFSQQIAEHVGDRHAWFVPNFSTTSPTDKAAAEIVLMDVVEKYFRFTLGRVICGIPCIELEGSEQDWCSLSERVDRFRELNLDWWIDPLQNILKQFAAASAGDVDSEFWRSIYRVYQPTVPCSQSTSLGWFAVLFPYITVGSRTRETLRSPWLSDQNALSEMLHPDRTVRQLAGERYKGLAASLLPSGLSRVPFQWRDQSPDGATIRERPMEFLAGFVGIRQDRQSMCLRPEIGWAVKRASGRNTMVQE